MYWLSSSRICKCVPKKQLLNLIELNVVISKWTLNSEWKGELPKPFFVCRHHVLLQACFPDDFKQTLNVLSCGFLSAFDFFWLVLHKIQLCELCSFVDRHFCLCGEAKKIHKSVSNIIKKDFFYLVFSFYIALNKFNNEENIIAQNMNK